MVEALRRVRIEGVERYPGERFECDLNEAGHLLHTGDIRLVDAPPVWLRTDGRDLHSVALGPGRWAGVVACLNVWNDLNALRQTIGTWYPYVDRVIAVDGAYPSTGASECASTDGTLEFLRSQSKMTLIEAPKKRWWRDQNEKRTAYLKALQPGDDERLLAFIVDADEFVSEGQELRRVGALDVGWVQVNSPIYSRPYGQPRLFRARAGLEYRGRHHWIYCGEELLTTHQYGGAGFVHAPAPIALRNSRGLGHTQERKAAKRTHSLAQHAAETSLVTAPGRRSDRMDAAREALRIAQVTRYDAGLAVSRLHSAINATTPHTSLMFREKDEGPYGALTQFERAPEEPEFNEAIAGADILHCHLSLNVVRQEQLGEGNKHLVLHHHGSMLRHAPKDYHQSLAEHYRALVLVSTLELLQHAPGATWLPNAMPVARYRRLREQLWRPSTTLRVAHSPSKREYKGTDAFLQVCEKLRSKGLRIEPVLIEGKAHGEALAMKAQSDVCFDSFWLGIQCSGLEAAAMGMPVIAGDPGVAGQYKTLTGAVPYTFADNATQLEGALVWLYENRAERATEADRVAAYALTWHDEAAVALRYLDALDGAFGWRGELAIENRPAVPPQPEVQRKPEPKRQGRTKPTTKPAPEPQHQEPEPVETR